MAKKSLKKRLLDPNSSTWRNKADWLWAKVIAKIYSGKCVVCGSIKYPNAHHLIPREMYSHRHLIENGVLVCPSCHKYSFQLFAHRGSAMFYKWLINTYPDKWSWIMDQHPSKEHTLTFKDAAIKLQEMLK